MAITTNTFEIESTSLRKAALTYRAINNRTRQQLLRLLDKEGRMPVASISAKAELDQSACSQHLAILRQARLVLTEREGKQIFYAVHYQQVKKLHQMAKRLLY